MRLIKENTFGFETLYESLKYSSGAKGRQHHPAAFTRPAVSQSGNQTEKYAHAFQSIASLDRQLTRFSTVDEIMGVFSISLKRVLAVKDFNIFYFDESGSKLQPVNKKGLPVSTQFINKSNKAGILDWIFESGRPTVVPEFDNYSAAGPKLSYLIIPIFDGKKKSGVFAALTPQAAFPVNSIEDQLIELMVSFVTARLNVIRKKDELQNAYSELQVYQSKLSNDFKLSAIGELTTGIVDDILSPLQVIMSYADFLQNDDNIDDKILSTIKAQIKKVEAVVGRLVKFASLDDGKFKLQPCNLNKLIVEFHKVVESSLRSENYECIVDLEEDIPSILSSPNYIYQILTNLLGLIKSSKNGGGILIQTKYHNEKVLLKAVSTDNNPVLNSGKTIDDINYKIINGLMQKHEGIIQTDSSLRTGSVVVLSFPLKRKIRA